MPTSPKSYKYCKYQTHRFLWQGLLVLANICVLPVFPGHSKNIFSSLPWNSVLPHQWVLSSEIHVEVPGPPSRPGLSKCPTRFIVYCWFLPEPILTRMLRNDGFPTPAFSPVSAQRYCRQEPSLLTIYLFIVNTNSLAPLIILVCNCPRSGQWKPLQVGYSVFFCML